ncbi:hypothetical protein MNBD_BACTEROID06-110 [hydrothermal vent metagenome]|uniref:Lipoprotein n=1 Tax=hydrothermal vent metagenome TaxID=652676 RepID=A0A3B0URY3_9ZZZZ
MKIYFFVIMLIFILTSCASKQTENEDVLISRIDILAQGNSLEDTNDMREVCKSFQLTRKQVLLYYLESRESTETEIHDSYDILPCNSTGTISINGEIFSWIIRAGGVGSFYNKHKNILRVCDETCCKVTNGIC